MKGITDFSIIDVLDFRLKEVVGMDSVDFSNSNCLN